MNKKNKGSNSSHNLHVKGHPTPQSTTSAPVGNHSNEKLLVSPLSAGQILGRKIDSPMLRIYVDNDESSTMMPSEVNPYSQKKVLEAISEKADKLKS